MRGLNKKCPSGFAQPIGRILGEQDLPWDAVSITQIQRTGLENPDFGSVFVRGMVAGLFTRRVLVTSGGCGPRFAKRRPLQRLTTAQMNGTLELALKARLKPSLLLLQEPGTASKPGRVTGA